MIWVRRFWLRLETLFSQRRVAEQLDNEIQFHLEQQTAEYVAAGMDPEEARNAAMRSFGNRTLLKEQTMETWGWGTLDQLGQDLRYGLRGMCRNAGSTIFAILIVGLGIGGASTVFSVVNALLLRPLPLRDPGQLVWITTRNYLRVVTEFAKYFGKPPDRLGLNELRTYQAYLLRERKLTPGTVVNQVAVLRFFFVNTLKRSQFRDFLPYPQDRRRLPTVLSREEVSHLINAAGNLFRRTLL